MTWWQILLIIVAAVFVVMTLLNCFAVCKIVSDTDDFIEQHREELHRTEECSKKDEK